MCSCKALLNARYMFCGTYWTKHLLLIAYCDQKGTDYSNLGGTLWFCLYMLLIGVIES